MMIMSLEKAFFIFIFLVRHAIAMLQGIRHVMCRGKLWKIMMLHPSLVLLHHYLLVLVVKRR